MTRVILAISGLVAMAVGAALLFAPVAFHAGDGIDLAGNHSLLSETRAAGGALLAHGALMTIGAIVTQYAGTAALVGALTYLAYGLSRVWSLAIDGAPATGLLTAMGFELLFGVACCFVLLRQRASLTP